MIKKILKPLMLFIFVASATMLISSRVLAVDSPLQPFCDEVKDADTEICKINNDNITGDGDKGILGPNGLVKKVIDLISLLTGIAAGVMIIVGGFKFTTSGGDTENIKSAKNMILFAVVGVMVVILSNVIIRFIINLVNDSN